MYKISRKNAKFYDTWISPEFSVFQTKDLVSWKQQSFLKILVWDSALFN